MRNLSPDSLVESRQAHVVKVRFVALLFVAQCVRGWDEDGDGSREIEIDCEGQS